jgi:hypothetical protein
MVASYAVMDPDQRTEVMRDLGVSPTIADLTRDASGRTEDAE